jgi:hypothetical protein
VRQDRPPVPQTASTVVRYSDASAAVKSRLVSSNTSVARMMAVAPAPATCHPCRGEAVRPLPACCGPAEFPGHSVSSYRSTRSPWSPTHCWVTLLGGRGHQNRLAIHQLPPPSRQVIGVPDEELVDRHPRGNALLQCHHGLSLATDVNPSHRLVIRRPGATTRLQQCNTANRGPIHDPPVSHRLHPSGRHRA